MMRGQTGHNNGDAENLLHEVLEHAMGIDTETPADSRRRKGKALAKEEHTRTPEAVKQCQTTPATTRYNGQTQTRDRLQHHAETSRAAMGGADQSDQGLRNTPWGLWSAAGKENKDLHVT
jgi:hypothetical protein